MFHCFVYSTVTTYSFNNILKVQVMFQELLQKADITSVKLIDRIGILVGHLPNIDTLHKNSSYIFRFLIVLPWQPKHTNHNK